jgi:peptidoglycan/LPS O-acetylase OafA/YrhL
MVIGRAATRPRLAYLDAMRALAALAVVVFHAFQQYGLGLADHGIGNERGSLGAAGLDQALFLAYDKLVSWCFLAVQVFIIISGYSLMLAVARSPDGRLTGGVGRFFKRRSWRILPPYYAALALSLALIAALPGMNRKADVFWDLALPGLEPGVILSHLLLVHNATWLSHLSRINPPMWSIAVEWQIYFLFPLLVVLWRAWGAGVTLALALLWGGLPLLFPVLAYPLSHSWFVGLFALGMLGANISFSRQPAVVRWRERLPWGRLALLATVAFGAFASATGRLGVALETAQLRDYVLGVAVVCLLIHCAQQGDRPSQRPSLALRALQTPALVGIGTFSYSLYLVHTPVLAAVALTGRHLELPVTVGYLINIGVGIPLALLAAYLFYLPFERPFLSAGAARPPVSQPHGTQAAPTTPSQ